MEMRVDYILPTGLTNMNRDEPFKDVDMAKEWGCLEPDKFWFVPMTHKFAPIILNNWDLDWMGWKYNEKYMLIPISDIHAIEKHF